MEHRPSDWRHAWLPAAWCLGVLFVLYGSTRGPFDPTSHERGANWPGDVVHALTQLTIETGILYALLRPSSYAASWKRSMIAFGLFAAWVVLAGIASMHTGRIYDYHWVWLVLVTIGLFAASLVSASVSLGITKRLPNER